MNAKVAELESAADRLRADMAQRGEDAAKRKTRLLLAIAGMFAIAVAVIGILVRWPGIG
ncbi:MAG: hypothetical protein OXF88_06090 [Rhodobacteraceae bacterium]|nr:hypothetical protein [Paracoccaceae bacterium]